jgi:hypothetical protein
MQAILFTSDETATKSIKLLHTIQNKKLNRIHGDMEGGYNLHNIKMDLKNRV